jgi:hypothetical protein
MNGEPSMRIKWINPKNQDKRDDYEHVPRSVAEVSIYNGEAVAAPYQSYVERLNEESKLPRKLQPGDCAVPNIEGTRWGIQEHPLAGTVILRESGSEQTRFSNADSALYFGCPKDLAKEFQKLMDTRQGNAEKTAQETKGNYWK